MIFCRGMDKIINVRHSQKLDGAFINIRNETIPIMTVQIMNNQSY